MSMIQTTSHEASAILKSLVNERPAVEVEWPAYADACRQLAEHPSDRTEQLLNRKRAHALSYLRTVRRPGGAYSKTASRVFTMQFVSELEQENAARRASRNPWLDASLQSSSNYGGMQGDNVLPFGPQLTPHDDAARLS